MRPWVPWLKGTLEAASAVTMVCALVVPPAVASPATAAASKTTTSPGSHPGTKAKTVKSKRPSVHPTSHKNKRSKKGSRRGQQKIDAERTHQIQEALIRQHYMSGSPSGKWDDSTEAALRKFQADNGWQNKTVPDSRALIKLGLGPNHDHLLNPESAMTTAPETPAARHMPSSTPAANGPSSSGQPQP